MPEPLLRALELSIGRRVDGLLAGDHRSHVLGRGSELAQIRPYEPGDDVRLIDWNVTARTRETHVRVQLAERVLVTWVVLDRTPSMGFGTADRRKADVALGVTLALGHAASVARQPRRARRRSAAVRPTPLPPRQGRAGLVGMLLTLGEEAARAPRPSWRRRSRCSAPSRASARSSPSSPTSAARATGGRRSSTSPLATTCSPSRSATRARTQLVDVGEVWFCDPETGGAPPRRHGRRAPARPVRRGSRAGAARGRCRPRGGSRVARRPLDERRLAPRPCRAPGKAPVSFGTPDRAARPARRAGARRAARRRRAPAQGAGRPVRDAGARRGVAAGAPTGPAGCCRSRSRSSRSRR